jgi:hypothetical protein
LTHTEQIAVFIPSLTPDYYGGVYESYIPATGAPTWATIRQSSGNQIGFLSGSPTESRFDIDVNDKDGWIWLQGQIIDSRFGYISVDSISEGQRKRTIRLSGNITTMDNFNFA